MQCRASRLAPLGLTLYQFALVLFVTGGKAKNLVHWDAAWYRDIAVFGYKVTLPLTRGPHGGSNIAFFPAFPVWVRAVIQSFGLDPDIGVSLAAQLACVLLWTYFLLLARRLGARPLVILAAAIALLVQPGAFYMVVGYSEALFTASMLGLAYWSTRAIEDDRQTRWVWAALACAHGGVLSGTRILGVVLVTFPLLLAAARALRTRRFEPAKLSLPLAISILSLWGFAAYLTYCHFRWGQWDIYWEANRVGWGVELEPWKIFKWSFYRDVFFFGTLSEVLGRIFTVATVAGSFGLGAWAWRIRERDPLPLALAMLNLGLQFETIVGSHGMHSMVRYLIPIHSLTFILAAGWAEDALRAPRTLSAHRARPGMAPWPSQRLATAYVMTALFCLAIQVLFAIRYSLANWVS